MTSTPISPVIRNDDFVFQNNEVYFYNAARIYFFSNDGLNVDDLDRGDLIEVEEHVEFSCSDWMFYTPGFNEYKDVSLEQFSSNYVIGNGYETIYSNSDICRVVVGWVESMCFDADLVDVINKQLDSDRLDNAGHTYAFDYGKWNTKTRKFDWD